MIIRMPMILLLWLVSCQASAEQWRNDRTASKLYFAPSYEGLPIKGEFSQFEVSVSSSDDLQPESLSVRVQIASADLGSSDLNQAIQMVDWFDSQKFAEASFVSEQIVATGADQQFVAQGRLSLKAATKTIEVPFSWQPTVKGGISMQGELTLDRSDFAIGSGEWSSGDQIGLAVKVWFDLSLVAAGD